MFVQLDNEKVTERREKMAMENSTIAAKLAEGVLPLFYLVPPSRSSFEHLHQVPDYVQKVVPYFFLFIFLEAGVRWLQNKPLPRINDSINSLSAGTIMQLFKLVVSAIEIISYAWVYENFCLYNLPWDSPITWWVAFIGVDCGYYWFHRMAHEVNLFWASHQVHHSSEEYNLTTALRQSMVQRFTSWFFYFPLALFVPPAPYLVHKQFNLLYQFWIHTEVIDSLGPLEWVLNTPSHHRVHHGRNPYCIDKNYAGVLIIWDRLFGTFEPEKEKVIYGLVHPLGTWDPFWAQIHHFVYLSTNIWSHKGVWNKLCFLFKGPGWSPGKPRLGRIEDIPEVGPDDKPYDREVPLWLKVYCVVQFHIVLYASQELPKVRNSVPYLVVLLCVAYLFLALTNFGLMFDCRQLSAKIEVARLLALIVVDFLLLQRQIQTGLPWLALTVSRVVNIFSLILWSVITMKQLTKENNKKTL